MVEEIAISLDTFIIESSEVYHSKRNDYLTSSQLKRFLGFPDGMKDSVPDEIRKQNFLIGKVAHSMILEGRTAFEEEFLKGKSSSQQILKDSQIKLIEELNVAVQANPQARKLLQTGFLERVVRALYCDLPCQIRIDWFNPFHGLVDLKTTDSLDQFDWEVRTYRYYEQLAFYRYVLKEATDVTVPVFFIIVGKKEMKCEVREVPFGQLDGIETENRKALEQMAAARQPGQWTGQINRITQ